VHETASPREVVKETREAFLEYQRSVPYPVEDIAEMDRRLDFIVRRLTDCVKARDLDVGLTQWNHRLEW
jgi:proteasome activator subunit 4